MRAREGGGRGEGGREGKGEGENEVREGERGGEGELIVDCDGLAIFNVNCALPTHSHKQVQQISPHDLMTLYL